MRSRARERLVARPRNTWFPTWHAAGMLSLTTGCGGRLIARFSPTDSVPALEERIAAAEDTQLSRQANETYVTSVVYNAWQMHRSLIKIPRRRARNNTRSIYKEFVNFGMRIFFSSSFFSFLYKFLPKNSDALNLSCDVYNIDPIVRKSLEWVSVCVCGRRSISVVETNFIHESHRDILERRNICIRISLRGFRDVTMLKYSRRWACPSRLLLSRNWKQCRETKHSARRCSLRVACITLLELRHAGPQRREFIHRTRIKPRRRKILRSPMERIGSNR